MSSRCTSWSCSAATAQQLHSLPRPHGVLRGGQCPAPARGPRPTVVVAAKKGGGGGKKGGGGQKKGPGLLASLPGASLPDGQPKPQLPYLDTEVILHNLLLIESYYRKTRKPFPLEGEVDISSVPRALWDAPFAVLAHSTTGPEPVFVYANAKGLELFECTWEELIGLPSRQSAAEEQQVQDERAALLAAALEKGFVDNYEGDRRTLKGRAVHIGACTLFNVDAPSGERVGQAVVIRAWEYDDGTKGGIAADEERAAVEQAAAAGPPAAGELEAAEAAVQEQAAQVRSLKQDQGLGNSSDEVQAAVQELLERKTTLEALQQRAAAASEAAA